MKTVLSGDSRCLQGERRVQKHVASALRSCEAISELRAPHMHALVTDYFVKQVVSLLLSPSSLVVLDLSHCESLTDSAIDCLGSAPLHSLSNLVLGSCNKITTVCALVSR